MTSVDEIVRESIIYARRNAEIGLPLDAGRDIDATLLALGLPRREALSEPPIAAVFLRESGPRRFKHRRPRKK